MLFALDYDGTYTAAPDLFDNLISEIKAAGHEIICLTMRRPNEPIQKPPCDVIYTSRRAKALFAAENGIKVNIWIDDNPKWFFNDG